MDRPVLEEAWKSEKDFKVRERILMVLELQDGLSSYKIGRQPKCLHFKVLYWKHRLQEEGLTGLHDKPRSGRPAKSLAEK
ncbi:helix-turn-helix domain-containing protein [Candidatus Bathyarchaeota archaeon]|nr:helix-turn-helix domain-containing protein [Candidatus Bathyarchaeota archaeon]